MRQRYRSFQEAREYVRTLGLKSAKEWTCYAKSENKPKDIPSTPRNIYATDGWVSMGDWLGTGRIADHLRAYRPFNKAREFVRSLGLKSGAEWYKYAKSGEKPDDIPTAPFNTYVDDGWLSWGDWLGTGIVAPYKRNVLSFKKARAFARNLGLKTTTDWNEYAKTAARPPTIPATPQSTYAKKGWNGWGDWLGTGNVAAIHREFLPFDEARAFVHALKLETIDQWREYSKSGKRPSNIPGAPAKTYAGHGWKGVGDWLGTGSVSTTGMLFRPFAEARLYVQKLGIRSQNEWREYSKSEKKPKDIPASPHKVYGDQGWRGFGDWLGTGTIAPTQRSFRLFDDARTFVRGLRLKSQKEWNHYTKSEKFPSDLPTAPWKIYEGNGWMGMGDWLGTGSIQTQSREFLPFEEAREFARGLCLPSVDAWRDYARTPDRPTNIPSIPSKTYANKGWLGWADWLGRVNVWNRVSIRSFVADLRNHLASLTAAELYMIFRQAGLLDGRREGRGFLKALVTGRFPKEELDNFIKGKESLVDQFFVDAATTLGSADQAIDEEKNAIDGVIESPSDNVDHSLPIVETKDVLASLGAAFMSSADEEVVAFLISSAVAKLWKHAFYDTEAARSQAKSYEGGGYGSQVAKRFLAELEDAENLQVPRGYSFRKDGKLQPPNLMQRLVTIRVREQRRYGNWSGTGAGKTLSAILASREIEAKLTIIACPNAVVDGWKASLRAIFPDSDIATKTFSPMWQRESKHRYLILNYESFQQPNSGFHCAALAKQCPDFVIIDEIHFAKQRTVENMSLRRENVMALIVTSAEVNPALHVLALSATPVINNLQEGKSMIELVTGMSHEELQIRPTVPNCMALHQHLVTLGTRWMPQYNIIEEQRELPVNCADWIDEIKALGKNGTLLQLEQLLTQARLPEIRKHVEDKTLIFTQYIQGIDRLLRDALEADGWRVGFYTGEDKTGLDQFINGDLNVLIGTSAIATGVDGLQDVCNRLIINVLPWTHAEFQQLKGRLYRQGQRQKKVQIIIPLTYAEIKGKRWSWCDSKMERLRFKKSIADAAVDGVVPEGHLRSPAQAYQDVMTWLERLEQGEIREIVRSKIAVKIPEFTDAKAIRHRFGDFSEMNRSWNVALSSNTHDRLTARPEEWAEYHSLYREARKNWAVVPFEELIRHYEKRSGYVIGDFGCGEGNIAKTLADKHTVYSLDHVAIDEDVIACDLAHVPLEESSLDVAIFSLSLMGANFADYICEAHRTLRLDGHLHIIEATSRFSDVEQFTKGVKSLGFDVLKVENLWKFTHIHALKTERRPDPNCRLSF